MYYDYIFSISNTIIFFSESIFLFSLILIFNSKHLIKLHKYYNENQKIHFGFISKVGGLAFLFSLVFNLLLAEESPFFLSYAIMGSIPIIIIGLLEDLFNNIKPRIRLFSIFLTSFILLKYPLMIFPIVNLPFLSFLFTAFPLIYFAFLIFSMTILANGTNMIDGTNGLMLTTLFFISITLFAISLHLGNIDFVNFYSLIIVAIVPLLLFNFPFQKIFSGDMGAYLLGLLIGFSVILLYGQSYEQLTWEIPLILFYPVYEVLFTIIRRFYNRQKTTKADTSHLHQLIFFYYNKKLKNTKLANNLVMPTLLPIIISPLIFFYFYDFALTIIEAIFALLFMIFLYQIYYDIFSKLSSLGNNE